METTWEARSPRRRRTREDVTQRIRDAARQLFADRGYAATTTKEIARLADVSETLLFRYYGDKAGLFNDVVTAPFERLMDAFALRHANSEASDNRRADTRLFTRWAFELFEANEDMFRALLVGSPREDGDEAIPGLRGLEPFLQQSVDQVVARYHAAGQEPPLNMAIGVRLGLGMIAASVLLRDALFPGEPPNREAVLQALEHIVLHSLGGPPP